MKAGRFPAELFGRRVATLTLPKGLLALRAVLSLDGHLIQCGHKLVSGETPIVDLCRALVAAEVEDCALLVAWADRAPALTIFSFRDAARRQQARAPP